MSRSELLCHLHERLAAVELAEVRREIEAVRERLAGEGERLEAALLEISSDTPLDDREELVAKAIDEHRRSPEYFPNQLRFSVLSLAYSVFENRISAVASAFLSLTNTHLVLADFAGESPLIRARRCMTRAAKVEIPADSWATLEPYRALRTVAVHSGGHFPKGPPKAVKQFIADSDEVEVTSSDGIVITDDLLEQYVGKLEGFYRQLFAAWRDWS